MKYETLGEYRTQFDLRTIRNIIVKQLHPSGDDSSVYEIFHRLNSGGVNLRPAEIRASLYYSPFLEMLLEMNLHEVWRRLIDLEDLDVNLRDVEILLRAAAMRKNGAAYTSSMANFLNTFAKSAKSMPEHERVELREELLWFIESADSALRDRAFWRSNKFSVTLFESAFAAAMELRATGMPGERILQAVPRLRDDPAFLQFSTARSSNRANVLGRLKRAREVMGS